MSDVTFCDVTGLFKSDVIEGLYAAARPANDGLVFYKPDNNLTDEQVLKLVSLDTIEYIKGRWMMVKFFDKGSKVVTNFYNCGNGKNKAENVIALLRKIHRINSDDRSPKNFNK